VLNFELSAKNRLFREEIGRFFSRQAGAPRGEGQAAEAAAPGELWWMAGRSSFRGLAGSELAVRKDGGTARPQLELGDVAEVPGVSERRSLRGTF